MPKEVFYKISDAKRDKLVLSAVKAFTIDGYDDLTVSKLTEDMNILRTDFYYYFKDKEDVMSVVKESFYKLVELNGNPSNVNDAIISLFSNISQKNKQKTKQFYIDIASSYNPLCVNTFAGLLRDRYGDGEVTIIDKLNVNAKLRLIAELIIRYFAKEIDRDTALELLK